MPLPVQALLAFSLLLAGVSGFTPHSPLKKNLLLQTSSRLFGIRCENKYYQLEEMEDKENATTELYLKEDGSILMGKTDGPLWSSASGTWNVKTGTDDFIMTIRKKFETGSKGRDMGEFEFTVSRTYEGDMTLVGENVAITGKMKDGILGDTKEVGFFNMIDGTDVRLDARSDARPGIDGEKDVTLVDKKNDATGTHKGAQGSYVGQPRGTSTSSASNLPFGWEEHYDLSQQKHYYVDSTSGITQWEKPEQTSLQSAMAPAITIPEALPAGWEEHFDAAQNRKYYVETATGTTQWEVPQPSGGALPAGWEEHMDPAQNKPYYVQSATGTSQWERPQ